MKPETREGQDYEPIACRTRLGWIVRGVIDRGYQVSSALSCMITRQTPPHDSTMEFGRFYDTEAIGIELTAGRMSNDPAAFWEKLPNRIF